MDRGRSWIREKAAASLNPSQVENTLLQLSETWSRDGGTAPPIIDVIEKFPLGEAALLHLIAMSSICATRLVRHPEILLWLGQPDVCLSTRGYEQMANDLRALAGDSIAAENFRALRFWKGREMARIALRELADVAPLEETTAELSQLAEICLSAVFKHWNSELRQRYGSPDAEFTMLALGKLGGGELNHSSDVDLIFLYSNERQVSPRFSYHEFFNRLGKKILETFSTRDPEGPLFRIDLRLRPEGSAGPLARSLESMEHYYGGFCETWERLALIKAGGICGSRELAYEFLRQHQPFIYPSRPTPSRKNRPCCDDSRLVSVFHRAENLPPRCKNRCEMSAQFFGASFRKNPRKQSRLIGQFSAIKNAPPRPWPIWRKPPLVSI